VTLGHVIKALDHRCGALAVSLHHDAETIPARQRSIRQQQFDDVQRQVEPVLFLGVDVKADVGGRGLLREVERARRQFRHNRGMVAVLVTWMQRRQLDRNSGARAYIALCLLCNCVDRLRIGLVVAYRVGLGACGFAEHIVGIGVALPFEITRVAQALFDGLPEHELAPQQLHRLRHGGTHQRLADAPHQAAQGRGGHVGIVFQHLAGQQQRPGGRIDQRRRRVAEVGAPVGRLDLVVDQLVDGLRIGHAQQGFGEAHQAHALVRRQTVLGQETLHHRRRGLASYLVDDPRTGGRAGVARAGVESNSLDQLAHQAGFVCRVVASDRAAKGITAMTQVFAFFHFEHLAEGWIVTQTCSR